MKLLLIALLLTSTPALAWDGYDNSTGSSVEIEKGNTVRQGSDIEVYDSSTGTYQDYEVESIRSFGSSVEVEVYDYQTGTYRTFDMDRN